MRIKIKAKDFTPIDLKKDNVVMVTPDPDDAESFDDDIEDVDIAKAVAWAFLSDVADDRYNKKYKDLVQEDGIRKPDGRVDKEKKVILETFVKSMTDTAKEKITISTRGVIGVLRNNTFNPVKKHASDIIDYLQNNKIQVNGQDISDDFETKGSIFDRAFDVVLQIGSRFDGDQKPYFLESMFIDEPFDFEKKENDVPPSGDSILEFLVLFLFKQQLQQAYESGPYRKYVRYEKNDSRLRGTVDVSRHIKLNASLSNGNVAYSYRENTPDNNITHLIIHAFEHAERYFPDYSFSLFFNGDNPVANIINDLRTLSPSFTGTNPQKVSAQSERIIDHPYYYRYEALRKTCQMILRFDGLSMFDGSDEDIQGVLFYIPTLWEHFLERQFLRDLVPFGHQMEAQYITHVYVKEDCEDIEQTKKTYPDFVFFNDAGNHEPLMVLDAKFRKEWGNQYDKLTLADLDDFYKCVSNAGSLGVHASGVIFPFNQDFNKANDSKKDSVCYNNSPLNHIDKFYTIRVVVPSINDDEDYSEWKTQFDKNLKVALNELAKILRREQNRAQELAERKEMALESVLDEVRIETAKEIAKSLKDNGVDISVIITTTGLSAGIVKNL